MNIMWWSNILQYMYYNLIGCNIFVAYDVELHKYYVIRVSGKTPESEENKKEKVTNWTFFHNFGKIKRKILIEKTGWTKICDG